MGFQEFPMPVANILLPGHDGFDGEGPRPPFDATLIPWIALCLALTAIACVWLGRATVPFFTAIAAWAGLALARRHSGPGIVSASPAAPHIRLAAPNTRLAAPTTRLAAPNTRPAAPNIRLVAPTSAAPEVSPEVSRQAPILRLVSRVAAR